MFTNAHSNERSEGRQSTECGNREQNIHSTLSTQSIHPLSTPTASVIYWCCVYIQWDTHLLLNYRPFLPRVSSSPGVYSWRPKYPLLPSHGSTKRTGTVALVRLVMKMCPWNRALSEEIKLKKCDIFCFIFWYFRKNNIAICRPHYSLISITFR